jgi:L-ribulose-5-phosphate 3-epimerase
MKHSIGIMQGRLSPPQGRGIQFFPFDGWEDEFKTAAKVGLDEIEFIFDFDRYPQNPLWSESGINKINGLVGETGVKVNHICADFFMRQPFFRVEESQRLENIEVCKKLILAAKQVGARTIEIPLVDNSSIKTEAETNILISSLQEVLPLAQEQGIVLGLETDLPPKPFLELLLQFNHPFLKANYDSGNSSSLGYDHYEEIITLGQYVHNVHIKDRLLGGTTVKLGTGDADFERFFQALKEINYQGSFILQVARGVEGDEPETIKSYLDFVKNYIQKYF